MPQTRESAETMGFEDRLSNIRDLPEHNRGRESVFLRQRHVRQFQRLQLDKPKWLACIALRRCIFFILSAAIFVASPPKMPMKFFFFSNRNNCYDSRTVEKKIWDRSVTEFLIRSAWLTAWLHAKWKSINRSERSFVVSDEGLPDAAWRER